MTLSHWRRSRCRYRPKRAGIPLDNDDCQIHATMLLLMWLSGWNQCQPVANAEGKDQVGEGGGIGPGRRTRSFLEKGMDGGRLESNCEKSVADDVDSIECGWQV